jgi:hypothetical protein
MLRPAAVSLCYLPACLPACLQTAAALLYRIAMQAATATASADSLLARLPA